MVATNFWRCPRRAFSTRQPCARRAEVRTERPNCERPPRSEDGGEEGALEVEARRGGSRRSLLSVG